MKIFLLLILLAIPSNTESFEAGINLSINQELFSDISSKVIPLLVQESKNIVVPDIHLSLKIALANLVIDITKIKFEITNFPYEKLAVRLNEPNLLNISISDFSGWGKFNLKMKYGFLLLSDYCIDINLKWINIQTQIEIDSQKSEKYNFDIPKVKIHELDVDLDFQFDMPESIFGKIIDLVASIGYIRDSIKNMLKEELQKVIDTIVLSDSETIINKLLNDLPVYVPIFKNISAEYALAHKPFVSKNSFIFSFKGTIVDPNIEDTWSPPFPLMELPYETVNGKTIQVFVSPYVINSGLFTLTKSELTFVLRDSDIPESSSFRLDTTSLKKFLPGLGNFPDHTPCELEMKLIPPSPVLDINTDNFSISPTIFGILYVVLPHGERENELTFQTRVEIEVTLSIQKNGVVKAYIEDFSIKKTKIIDSKIGSILVWMLEKLLNASMIIVRPIINSKFLGDLKISLPIIQGIEITDSNLLIRKTYIEAGLSPRVDIEKFFSKYFLDVLKENRMNRLEKLGLKRVSNSLKFLE